MKPTTLIAESTTPEGDHLALYSHDGHYFLKANGAQLRTSFSHGSEEELARLACAPIRAARQPHVLIGGLGMGFTLAAACAALPQKGATFTVAETIPEVVQWNQQHLNSLHPGLWEDPRVRVHPGLAQELIARGSGLYQAILLDMDQDSDASTGAQNEILATNGGLGQIAAALKEGGFLAVWSASPNKSFEKRLRLAGYEVQRIEVPAVSRGKQRRQHIIWLATKGHYQSQRRSNHL